jgi:hypothetical protein
VKIEFLTELNAGTTTDYSIGQFAGSCIVTPLSSYSLLGAPGHVWNVFARTVYLEKSTGGFDRAVPYSYVDANDKILQDNIIAVNE